MNKTLGTPKIPLKDIRSDEIKPENIFEGSIFPNYFESGYSVNKNTSENASERNLNYPILAESFFISISFSFNLTNIATRVSKTLVLKQDRRKNRIKYNLTITCLLSDCVPGHMDDGD